MNNNINIPKSNQTIKLDLPKIETPQEINKSWILIVAIILVAIVHVLSPLQIIHYLQDKTILFPSITMIILYACTSISLIILCIILYKIESAKITHKLEHSKKVTDLHIKLIEDASIRDIKYQEKLRNAKCIQEDIRLKAESIEKENALLKELYKKNNENDLKDIIEKINKELDSHIKELKNYE